MSRDRELVIYIRVGRRQDHVESVEETALIGNLCDIYALTTRKYIKWSTYKVIFSLAIIVRVGIQFYINLHFFIRCSQSYFIQIYSLFRRINFALLLL